RPDASQAEVMRQLQATATPAGGPNSPEYGYGIVNPYAAVTMTVLASPGQAPAAIEPAALGSAPDSAPTVLAVTGAVVAATVVTLVLVLAVAVPRGRSRRWRPTLAPLLREREPGEAGPPLQLFDGR